MDYLRLACAPVLAGLVEGFFDYVSDNLARDFDNMPKSVGFWLERWVADPTTAVIEDCGGDFATFLQAVIFIVTQVFENPEHWDDRRVPFTETFVIGDGLPACLDPQKWREWVFRRQIGKPIDL